MAFRAAPQRASGIASGRNRWLTLAAMIVLGLIALAIARWRMAPHSRPGVSGLRPVTSRVEASRSLADDGARAQPAAAATPLELGARHVLFGTVRSRGGPPLGAASLCAFGRVDGWRAPAVCTLSDTRGGFELQRPREPATVLVSAPGHAPRAIPVELLDGASTPVLIELDVSDSELGGTVRDASGGVVAGAVVSIRREASTPIASAVADDDGVYRLGAPPGPVEVSAEAEGYARATKTVVAPKLALDITLAPATTLRGRVIEAASSSGVAGARIRAAAEIGTAAAAATATAGEDGHFVIDGLPVGTYEIEAVAPGARGRVEAVTVGLGEEHVIVSVSAATPLAANVTVQGETCRAGRASVEGALVETAVIEPDGSVRVDGLPPGRYFVSVVCSHGAERGGAVGEFSVDVGTEPESHAWDLTQPLQVEDERAGAASLVVTIEQPLGSAAPLAAFLIDESQQVPLRAPVQNGRQVFGALKPGGYDVYLEQLPRVHRHVTLEREGEVTEVTLVAPRRVSMRGLVLDSDSQPAADVWVRAYHLEYPFGEFASAGEPVLTDATGEFHIVGLLDANYQLVANGPAGSAEVERASADATVTLTLGARAATID
jgi:hypothetical protein